MIQAAVSLCCPAERISRWGLVHQGFSGGDPSLPGLLKLYLKDLFFQMKGIIFKILVTEYNTEMQYKIIV